MTRGKTGFTIDGRRASLREIRRAAREDSLQHELGSYVSGGEARRAGIGPSELRRWRGSGRVRGRKVRGAWYYSKQDLLEALEAEANRTRGSR